MVEQPRKKLQIVHFSAVAQKKENKTGLPTQLKEGGYDMSDATHQNLPNSTPMPMHKERI